MYSWQGYSYQNDFKQLPKCEMLWSLFMATLCTQVKWAVFSGDVKKQNTFQTHQSQDWHTGGKKHYRAELAMESMD